MLLLTLTTVCYAQTYTVERVVDGDTIELSNGEIVRLIGIDCLENEYSPAEATYLNVGKKWERSSKDVEQAKVAAEFTKGLVEGKKVRIVFDVGKKDKYGRLLAYVYLQVCSFEQCGIWKAVTPYSKLYPEGKYTMLNAEIIRDGYASPMTIPPNVKYAELFKKLYEEAREEGGGLWSKNSSKTFKYNEVGVLSNSKVICFYPDGKRGYKNCLPVRFLVGQYSNEFPQDSEIKVRVKGYIEEITPSLGCEMTSFGCRKKQLIIEQIEKIEEARDNNRGLWK